LTKESGRQFAEDETFAIWSVNDRNQTTEEILQELRTNPDVIAAEPNYIAYAANEEAEAEPEEAAEAVEAEPEEATEAVISSQDDQRLYFCNGYTMEIQTLAGGDLEKTVKMISGYLAQDLTIVKTRTEGVKKAQWVWSSVGESGDQLGRAVVLDDGRYHYCVSVMSDASVSGQLEQEWETVFASVTLTNQGS
jgi:hypothetical protein